MTCDEVICDICPLDMGMYKKNLQRAETVTLMNIIVLPNLGARDIRGIV